jgi:hypothetical protein
VTWAEGGGWPSLRSVKKHCRGHVEEFLSAMRHRRPTSGWPISGTPNPALQGVTPLSRWPSPWRAGRYGRVAVVCVDVEYADVVCVGVEDGPSGSRGDAAGMTILAGGGRGVPLDTASWSGGLGWGTSGG